MPTLHSPRSGAICSLSASGGTPRWPSATASHTGRDLGQEHNTQVLRRWLLSVPARLVHGGRRWYLRLARGMSHKQEFWALHRYLAALGAGG